MSGKRLAAIAALGIALASAGASADDQLAKRVNLRAAPAAQSSCLTGTTAFFEVNAAGNFLPPAFIVPPGLVFVLTDVEWSAVAINANEVQELIVQSTTPPADFQAPFLIVPATVLTASNAYGQVHLATGIALTRGICANVTSGKPGEIYLQGYLQPGG